MDEQWPPAPDEPLDHVPTDQRRVSRARDENPNEISDADGPYTALLEMADAMGIVVVGGVTCPLCGEDCGFTEIGGVPHVACLAALMPEPICHFARPA